MIPATPARMQPMSVGDMKGMSTSHANTAPTGSASPESSERRNALRRSPVA